MSVSQKKRSTTKSSISYEVPTSSSVRKSLLKTRDRQSLKPALIPVPRPVTILLDGLDVTPCSLNPYVYEAGRERQISILDNLTKDQSFMVQQRSSLNRVDSQRFQTNILLQKQEMETATMTRRSIVTSAYYGDDIVIPAFSSIQAESEVSVSATNVEEGSEAYPEPPIPTHISLILQETETFFLLHLPSSSVPKDGEEAAYVQEDNDEYDFLTQGKGRHRKVIHVGVQTAEILRKARDTETSKVRFRNNSTFVCGWEMYDTFKKMETKSSDEDSGDISFSDEEMDPGLEDHRLKSETSLESYRMSSEDKELNKIVKSKAFQDALIVIERILGNNCYNDKQKRYKGLSDPDVFREDIEYKYRLQLLWTYANHDTEGKCVSAMALNSFNEDIVAVAYGKYFYVDRDCVGMVMVWNIKNPQQPERKYDFPVPVTSVAFSNLNPNLLAVGFYNGHLKILDICKRELAIVREDTSRFEPVWDVVWFRQGDDEDLMVSFSDGRVIRYQITTSEVLKQTQIMMTAAAEGKLKGIVYLKKCEGKDISITGFDEARCLALHPTDVFTYFVGTSDGVVHRCSTNYYNEHMDLFKAHDGAIHTIRFSPFANKLYLTCGDDFRARLWVDGISEPLVTTEPSVVPVLDVDWSPAHPTIIATIRGSEVRVWDMQRKMYQSQSVHKTQQGIFNTVCRFTTNGRCLMVGDMSGDVSVYSLEDMPIAPFFPENLIQQSLKRLLLTRPNLLRKLKKLGSLNFDKQSFMKYFN